MLDDSHAGKDGKGVWLWTLASGLILFLMEFILFAALVPTDWARQASRRELASLVDTVGPDTASAILAQAAGWYEALFIRTGLHSASYGMLIPGPDAGRAGLAKLADSPFWPWLAGRLTVVWWSLDQACRRLAVLLSWWPLLGILGLAAWGDGWLRRRIRQSSVRLCEPFDPPLGAARGPVAVPRRAPAARGSHPATGLGRAGTRCVGRRAPGTGLGQYAEATVDEVLWAATVSVSYSFPVFVQTRITRSLKGVVATLWESQCATLHHHCFGVGGPGYRSLSER